MADNLSGIGDSLRETSRSPVSGQFLVCRRTVWNPPCDELQIIQGVVFGGSNPQMKDAGPGLTNRYKMYIHII
jgi:hypothetical protein